MFLNFKAKLFVDMQKKTVSLSLKALNIIVWNSNMFFYTYFSSYKIVKFNSKPFSKKYCYISQNICVSSAKLHTNITFIIYNNKRKIYRSFFLYIMEFIKNYYVRGSFSPWLQKFEFIRQRNYSINTRLLKHNIWTSRLFLSDLI